MCVREKRLPVYLEGWIYSQPKEGPSEKWVLRGRSRAQYQHTKFDVTTAHVMGCSQ